MNIEVLSFGSATVAFLLLALAMLTGRRDNLPKRVLALAALTSAIWAAAVTYQAAYEDASSAGMISATLVLELIRALGWFAFLLVMLRTAYKTTPAVSRRFRITFTTMSVFIIGLMILAQYRISGGAMLDMIAGNDVLVGHLLISIGGMLIIEQLYRNTADEHRWALKYLWMGIGGMFAYDFYMYSNAMLYQRIDNELWNARGFIHAIVVPVIGVAIRREMRWSLGHASIDIFISRSILFHTTTLVGAGLYMLIIGSGSYFVRELGGTWGIVAQAAFVFGATLVLAILIFSSKVRARLRVQLEKHFFHYKYDYRDEWLRIIRTLSVNNEVSRLHERAIRALAQIIDSPGGILWLKRANGCFEAEEHWNMEVINVREPGASSFVRFLEEQQFVISLDEFRRNAEVYVRLAPLEIPSWLDNIRNAWLVVPLVLNESLTGFVVLARSPAHTNYYNWEDSDLLKTAAKQAASHLAQHQAAQELVSAKRFEEVNRLSAFIVHDLKNMIAQLSMVVSNAAKHKNNPLFMEDAVSTVENSVVKLNKLLSRLRGDTADNITTINLCELLEETVRASSKTGALPIPVLNCQVVEAKIIADRDRMAANIAHLIQNSRDACNQHGRITIRLKKSERYVIIEVEDTGCGMDEAFMRERLFKPFESTKGTMGIGVFQVREYVEKLGGEVEVDSRVNEGTVFRLHLPFAGTQEPAIKHAQILKLDTFDKRVRDV